MKHLFSVWILILPMLSFADGTAPQDTFQKQIAALSPICKDCKFVTRKIDSKWIKKASLYRVFTLDVFPPAIWHGIVMGDQADIVHFQRIEPWNTMIKKEQLELKNDAQVVEFSKFFVEVLTGQTEFVDKLSPGEIAQLEKQLKKKVNATYKINRTGPKIQAVFFSRNVQGVLQEWNIVFSNAGEILKIQERSVL